MPHGTFEPHWSWFPFYLHTFKSRVIWWTSDSFRSWIFERDPNTMDLLRPNLCKEIEAQPNKLGGIINSWSQVGLIVAEGVERSVREERKGGIIRRWRWTSQAIAEAEQKLRRAQR